VGNYVEARLVEFIMFGSNFVQTKSYFDLLLYLLRPNRGPILS
jgi:hypothetical protein